MFTLNCNGRLLVIDEPVVMGIINITPDSFYGNSRHASLDEVVNTAGKMLNDGAVILDIGGQSTRPNSELLPAEIEMQRVTPAIEALSAAFPSAYISIDTFYAAVAAQAVAAGACIVNDISAGNMDAGMLSTVAALHVPYIAMHMPGTPQNMQQHALYENVTLQLLDYFIKKIKACHAAGIHDIIIDPGFGFGKTAQHNLQLLQQLDAFHILGKPLLAGLSRKATIYKTLGTSASEALNGTTVLNTIALQKGANILRVHDVREAREAIQLLSAMKSEVSSSND